MIDDFAELPSLYGDWRGIATSRPFPSVFQHPGWVDSWWHSFGGGRRLFAVIGYDGDALIGLMPLMIDAAHRQAQFIGHPLNDRNGAVCLDDYREHFWSATVDLLAKHGVASAHFPDIVDFDAKALVSLHRPEITLTPSMPSPLIELPKTWEEFIGRHDGRRVRKWDYERRKLAELGALRFECLSGDEVTTDLMHSFHHNRIERWASRGRLAELSLSERSEIFAKFMARLAANLARDQELYLGRLYVGTSVVAQDLYFVWPGVVLNYMKAYRPELSKYSPGRQATLAGIRHFISAGLPLFDFGRGDEPYKFNLGAKARDLNGVVINFGV